MSKLLFCVYIIGQSILIGFASDLDAQRKPLNEIEIDVVNLENAPLIELIDLIEGKTDFKFAYPSKLVRKRHVNVQTGSWDMKSLLQKVSKQTQITIKRVNESIVLAEVDEGSGLPQLRDQILNDVVVKGQVTDENGEPLPGATIVEKGTSNGNVTDLDGQFSLSVKEGAVLLVSFVGYKTVEVTVAAQTKITVRLEPDFESLDEVVVVGFGTQKKRDLTGAVASANIKDFKDTPNTNLVQSLQGTVPGLNIGQVNSAGSTPDIQVRGANTINGNKSVLIVLDGIQYNGSLSSINPNDIASIDVLKDASSTAVYGAQAANGVILITSKKGNLGDKPEISFSTSYTTQRPTVGLRPMRRQAYIDHVRDLYWDQSYLEDGTLNPDYDITNGINPALFDDDGNLLENDYDWWDKGTDPGFISKNELSLKGGGENISYLISGGLTNQEGFIIGDKFNRKSLRVNLEAKATPWLKIGAQTFGSFVNQDGTEPSLSLLMRQSPLLEPYDENGDLVINPFNTIELNPFLSSDVDDYERHNYLFANLYSVLEVPFIKGLSYRINYGQNYRLDKRFQSSIYAAGQTGQAYKEYTEYYDYTFDNIVTYTRDFNRNHSLTTTLLYGSIERQSSKTNATAQGFSRLNLSYNDLSQGEIQKVSSEAWDEALDYQMARLNYKFRNKYLLTATVRRDGFSGFAKNEKYGIFPSVALGWVASEDFSLPSWIDFLKLRGGYGTSGNQTPRYTSISKVEANNSYLFGDDGTTLVGQEVTSMGNPNLRWEKTRGLNLGVDFDFLGGRISGNAEYYNNKSKDLLYEVALPPLSGFDKIQSNAGELQNSGFELLLNTKNVVLNDFSWTTMFSFSRNKNKILTLLGEDNDGDGKEDDLIASRRFIGEPLGTIYGYEVNGIYQLNEENIPAGYYPGTYRIVDQGGTDDYDINPTDDRVILGYTEPAFRAGLMNKIAYKGISLSIFLNTIQGGKNGYRGNNSQATSRSTNTLAWNYISEIDYWSPGNPDGEYPRSVATPSQGASVYFNRSFVRLQDVILSYRLPQSVLSKMNVKDINVFVSGKNLATWTKWKGWDPEANIKNSSGGIANYGTGYQVGGRPVMKGYSVGLNITL